MNRKSFSTRLLRLLAGGARAALPDSGPGQTPYAEVLRERFLTLKFPRAMEGEYRQARAPVLRQRFLVIGLLGILAVGMLMLVDALTKRYLQFPLGYAIVLGWMLPLIGLFSVVAALDSRRLRYFLLIAGMQVALAAAPLVLEIVLAARHSPGAKYAYVMLLVVVFSFFIADLLTRRTLFASLAVIAMYAAVHAAVAGGVTAGVGYDLLFLGITAGAGVAGGWWMEHADREQFLLSAILFNMAEHDSLTGLLNHAAFISHCERTWEQAARERKPVGMLIADIDEFKRYNDCHGHPAGDECIRQVAGVVKRAARRALDATGRLGGEEFAIFWYDMPAAETYRAAEKLRAGVEDLSLQHEGSSVARHVTASVGALATVPQPGQAFRTALKAIDEALYAAKEAGRNRVVATSSLPASPESLGAPATGT